MTVIESLANVAPSEGYSVWLSAVQRSLMGAEESFGSRSYDGIVIGPLYAMEDGGQIWRTGDTCRIVQRIDHPDLLEANMLARADLEGGASSLAMVLEGAPSARGFGLRMATADDLATALSGIRLDAIELRFEGGFGAPTDTWMKLADLIEHEGVPFGNVHVDFGFDPIGMMACSGGTEGSWRAFHAQAMAAVQILRSRGYQSPVMRADARPHHEAGASEAQELAALLATGVDYLRAFEREGLSIDEARAALSFTLVADADLFLSLTKFRALRQLWSRIETGCGLPPRPIKLHGETAWRMVTKRDPWTNMLRGAVACTAALLGGADSITALPHTAALGLADAFARRVARNVPLLLLEEAGLGRVDDPAAGSGAFEALTHALCAESWQLFQTIEGEGGMAAALLSGSWQARIAGTHAARQSNLRDGTNMIVGTPRFVEAEAGLTPVQVTPRAMDSRAGPRVPPLPSIRDAEPFEGEARA